VLLWLFGVFREGGGRQGAKVLTGWVDLSLLVAVLPELGGGHELDKTTKRTDVGPLEIVHLEGRMLHMQFIRPGINMHNPVGFRVGGVERDERVDCSVEGDFVTDCWQEYELSAWYRAEISGELIVEGDLAFRVRDLAVRVRVLLDGDGDVQGEIKDGHGYLRGIVSGITNKNSRVGHFHFFGVVGVRFAKGGGANIRGRFQLRNRARTAAFRKGKDGAARRKGDRCERRSSVKLDERFLRATSRST
jgi:hypothetical protein